MYNLIFYMYMLLDLFLWRSLMGTAERVAFFEAELAKFEFSERKFNVMAFIFSSFYFWYLGMSGMFAFFALLPIILELLFLFVINDMAAAVACGFVTAHSKSVFSGGIRDCFYRAVVKCFRIYRCGIGKSFG